MHNIIHHFLQQLSNTELLILMVNAVLHILFAGAVAKDAGDMQKRGINTIMVSGVTWSFATLIGGVTTATIYWILHHSQLTKASK